MNRIKLKNLLLPLFFLWTVFTANAQKLPTIQQNNLRAPINIKVDGKPNEWRNKFQAYNSSTEIYYTIANDDSNLYLAIQAIEPDIVNKIIGGGVTLTIQKSDKKNVQITYPITNNVIFNLKSRRGIVPDTSAKAADSVMNHNNNILGQKCKWIKVAGIEGLDTLISVYNTDGVRAVGLFDNKRVYTLEFAISFKCLGLSPTDAAKFTYHIQLNGKKVALATTATTEVIGPPISNAELENSIASLNARIARQTAPTDFWGSYTLAKK